MDLLLTITKGWELLKKKIQQCENANREEDETMWNWSNFEKRLASSFAISGKLHIDNEIVEIKYWDGVSNQDKILIDGKSLDKKTCKNKNICVQQIIFTSFDDFPLIIKYFDKKNIKMAIEIDLYNLAEKGDRSTLRMLVRQNIRIEYEKLLKYACKSENEIYITHSLEKLGECKGTAELYKLYKNGNISPQIMKICIGQIWKDCFRDWRRIIKPWARGNDLLILIYENDDVEMFKNIYWEDVDWEKLYNIGINAVLNENDMTEIMYHGAESIMLLLIDYGYCFSEYELEQCCKYNKIEMCDILFNQTNTKFNEKKLGKIFTDSVADVEIAKLFI